MAGRAVAVFVLNERFCPSTTSTQTDSVSSFGMQSLLGLSESATRPSGLPVFGSRRCTAPGSLITTRSPW